MRQSNQNASFAVQSAYDASTRCCGFEWICRLRAGSPPVAYPYGTGGEGSRRRALTARRGGVAGYLRRLSARSKASATSTSKGLLRTPLTAAQHGVVEGFPLGGIQVSNELKACVFRGARLVARSPDRHKVTLLNPRQKPTGTHLVTCCSGGGSDSRESTGLDQ
jgi:hypothetical protein